MNIENDNQEFLDEDDNNLDGFLKDEQEIPIEVENDNTPPADDTPPADEPPAGEEEETLDFLTPPAADTPPADTPSEEEELAELNKKFETDFKSMDEMRASLKGLDSKSEKEEEEIQLATAKTNVQTFTDIAAYDDERLVRQNFMAEANQAKKDISKQEVKDEIEAKVQSMLDNDTLSSHAKAIRASLQGFIKENQKTIDEIDGKRKVAEKQTVAEINEQRQNAFAEIFKNKEFYGVTVTKEIVEKTYKSVQDLSFFKKVNADQRLIADVAMFVELREEIQKKTGGPTHSDGIQKVLAEIKGENKPNRSVAANAPASREAASSLIAGFIK